MKAIGIGSLACLILFSNFKFSNSNSFSLKADTIRVLSFNILYGGDEIDFSKVVVATALGWKYFDTRLHLLSKYPVISSDAWGWYYALIEIQPGKVIAFSNVHLPSDPYGPDLGA
jgi:hypothetical protein